jgi:hypothetical protein
MESESGLETFLSYKTNSGTTFNAGRFLRYHSFLLMIKDIRYDEKLHSIGLKIGMVKKFLILIFLT